MQEHEKLAYSPPELADYGRVDALTAGKCKEIGGHDDFTDQDPVLQLSTVPGTC